MATNGVMKMVEVGGECMLKNGESIWMLCLVDFPCSQVSLPIVIGGIPYCNATRKNRECTVNDSGRSWNGELMVQTLIVKMPCM